VTAPTASGPQATGTHDRETFVRLFFAIYRHQRSGKLEVSFGRKHRTLYLVGGVPVAYQSDLQDDELSRTLVNANLVPAKQMKWVKEKLSKGERLEDALVMSGAITTEQLAEHKQARLKVNIGSPLVWGSGEWTFTPALGIHADRIDPKLRPESDCLSAMWAAVVQHVSMDAVFPYVTDQKAGNIELDPICPALFPAFEVDEALQGVPDTLMDGAEVDDVFRMVPDSSGNLVKLLWFLEAAGMAKRAGRAPSTTLNDLIEEVCNTPRQAVPDATPSPPTKEKKKRGDARGRRQATTPKKRVLDAPTDDQIRTSHRKRIGRDYYAFLGLPPTAASAGIDRKCKALARRWRSAQNDRTLPQDVQEKLEAMLAGVQLVWRILTNPDKRAEYDKRLSRGRAPRVGDLRASTTAPMSGAGTPQVEIEEESDALSSEHRKAKDLIGKGDFAKAMPYLKKARLDEPSSPDIMADLGMVTWKLKGTKNGDAEEFLRLALTFNPEHSGALETLARISVESNELDLAKKLLNKLLKVADDPSWAKRALKNLDKGTRKGR